MGQNFHGGTRIAPSPEPISHPKFLEKVLGCRQPPPPSSNCVSLTIRIFCWHSSENSHHKSRSASLEINPFSSHTTWNKLFCEGGEEIGRFAKGPTPTFIFSLRNEGQCERAISSTTVGLEEKFILVLLTSPLHSCREKSHTTQRNISLLSKQDLSFISSQTFEFTKGLYLEGKSCPLWPVM